MGFKIFSLSPLPSTRLWWRWSLLPLLFRQEASALPSSCFLLSPWAYEWNTVNGDRLTSVSVHSVTISFSPKLLIEPFKHISSHPFSVWLPHSSPLQRILFKTKTKTKTPKLMILLLSFNHEKWLHVPFQCESQALNVAYWSFCSLVPPYTSATLHSSLTFYFVAAWSCPTEDWGGGLVNMNNLLWYKFAGISTMDIYFYQRTWWYQTKGSCWIWLLKCS